MTPSSGIHREKEMNGSTSTEETAPVMQQQLQLQLQPYNGGSMNPGAAAADLIKSLDVAFANMNSRSVAAAQDAEEARRNARTASQLARLYQLPSSAPSSGNAAAWASYSNRMLENASRGGYVVLNTPPTSGNSLLTNGSNHHHSHIAYTPYSPIINTPPRTRKIRTGGGGPQQHSLSPAEDVLALSLELERTKQALEEEQTTHKETLANLQKSERKSAHLEQQMEQLLSKQETNQQQHELCIQELTAELQVAQTRAETAEEDAQEALSIAKLNVESREQLEEWLQRALEEIQVLRAHMANQRGITNGKQQTTSSGDEDVEEDLDDEYENEQSTRKALQHHPTSLETIVEEDIEDSPTHPGRPSRRLVAAGRQLLLRANMKSPDNTSTTMVVVPSPGDAAERRRRLKERLLSVQNNTSSSSSKIQHSSPSPPRPHTMGTSVEALDICRRATRILRESGRRLRLAGRWWTGGTTPHQQPHAGPDELYLDSMARHYCMEVESLLEHKSKEIRDLESFCSLLESGSSSQHQQP